MGEIGRIERTIDPEDLPEDLRETFVAGKPVSVVFEGELSRTPGSTVGTEPPLPHEIEARLAWVHNLWGAASHLRTSEKEAVDRIRALRDEWD